VFNENDERQVEELLSVVPPELRETLRQKLEEMQRRQRGDVMLAERLNDWLQAPNWRASREFLELHQAELLTDDAERVLQRMADENRGRDELPQHLEVLQRARRDGIVAAYARIEASQELGESLLSTLLEGLPAAERERRLEQLLSQAPLELRGQVRRKLEEARQQRRDEAMLVERLNAWIETPTWRASREFLETYQIELLTDDAERVLQRMADENRGQIKFRQHVEILQRARRDGIAAAYAQINTADGAAGALAGALAVALTAALIEALPPEMISEENERQLEQLLNDAPPELREPLQRKLEEVRQRRRNPTLADRVKAWVRTPNWSASRAYLEEHQGELLTDAAEQVLRDLAQRRSRERQWSQHLEILQRARRDGIAAAYAHIQAGQEIGGMLLGALLAALPPELIDEDDERRLEQLLNDAPPELREPLQRKLEEVRRRRRGS
jgi:hypothetical protein